MSTSETAPGASFDHLHSLTLVLSSARAGSTLLCQDIASLGGLGMPREYLRGLRTKPRRSDATEADVLERVANGVREDAPGVASVKLMVAQSSVVHEALTGHRAPSEEALPRVISWAEERFERVYLVFLVRNAIDQAISRVVASTTGVFHSSSNAFDGEGTVPVEIPDINQQILANLGRVARDREILLNVHAQHADRGLLVTYDELSRQVDATGSRLVAHARAQGFEVKNDTVTRRLKKVINPERATEIREAFLEYLRTETGVAPEPSVDSPRSVPQVDAPAG